VANLMICGLLALFVDAVRLPARVAIATTSVVGSLFLSVSTLLTFNVLKFTNYDASLTGGMSTVRALFPMGMTR
jgi:hypothetical protein